MLLRQAALMFWWKRDRRKSSQEEREEFERRKAADELERQNIEQRLEFLRAEADLLTGVSNLDRRRTTG